MPEVSPASTDQIVTFAFWGFFSLILLYSGWNLKRTSNTLDAIARRQNEHDKQLAVLLVVPANIDELYTKVNKIDKEFSRLKGEHNVAMAQGLHGLHVHARAEDANGIEED